MSVPANPKLHPRIETIGAVLGPGGPAAQPLTLRDSMHPRIVLLRYGMISLITGMIDNVTFYFVFRGTGSIAGAQAAGRIASMLFNYRAVRRTVFCSDERHHIVLPRYLSLVAVNALISYAVIRLLSAFTPLGVIPSKILAETLMFFANFMVQRAYIFTRRAPAEAPSVP